MHRITTNVSTGEVKIVQQKVYKNLSNELIVLDLNEAVPEGFFEIQEADLVIAE